MIFYGWNHVIEKCMGEFQDNTCSRCNESMTYQLIRVRTFFTLFFIPLICYRTEYYFKCTACKIPRELTKREAYDIMDNYLPFSKRKMMIGNVIRYTIMAAVVGLLALAIISGDEETVDGEGLSIRGIYAMVPDDGNYLIYNPDGDVVADITVTDGDKNSNVYYEYYPFTEEVPEGHEFTAVYYSHNDENGKLSLIEDMPMVLCDEHMVGIRYHWYDAEEEQIYWVYGVNDFNDIEYGVDRIVYPLEQSPSETETEYYSKVRVQDGEDHAVVTFYHGTNNKDENTVTLVDISIFDPVTHSEERLQYYQEMDITPDVTFAEILDYIETNDLQYDARDYKVFYQGIEGITEHEVYEEMVEGSDELSIYEYDYEVIQHENGYYIAKLVE